MLGDNISGCVGDKGFVGQFGFDLYDFCLDFVDFSDDPATFGFNIYQTFQRDEKFAERSDCSRGALRGY